MAKILHMNKSAFISDLIFSFFVTFLLTLCIFRYVGVSLIIAILLSGVCGTLCSCALGALWQSKRKTTLLKRSELALKEKLHLHLCLLSPEKARDLFYEVFLQNPQTQTTQKYGKTRMETPTDYYFFYLQFSPVTAEEVAKIYRFSTAKNKVLVCLQMEEQAFALCHRLGITPNTGEWAYAFLKKYNALPQTYLGEEITTDKRKRRLRICFAKNNARRFVISALFVLMLSFFTPFSLYYFIFAFLLLITAIFIRVFGYS